MILLGCILQRGKKVPFLFSLNRSDSAGLDLETQFILRHYTVYIYILQIIPNRSVTVPLVYVHRSIRNVVLDVTIFTDNPEVLHWLFILTLLYNRLLLVPPTLCCRLCVYLYV